MILRKLEELTFLFRYCHQLALEKRHGYCISNPKFYLFTYIHLPTNNIYSLLFVLNEHQVQSVLSATFPIDLQFILYEGSSEVVSRDLTGKTWVFDFQLLLCVQNKRKEKSSYTC
jgi:hypothetical protein